MNLIIFTEKDYTKNISQIQLSDYRHQHILKILKAKIGTTLSVGLLNNKIGTGTITKITKHSTTMDVHLVDNPPAPAEITLILALPRPLVLNRILSSISSMGIKHLILLQTKRVEKSYWKSPVLENKNIHKQLILGLEQARDTILPEISLKKRFKTFIEDELPALTKGKKALIAHPNNSKELTNKLTPPYIVAIGPEGGFIDYEVESLVSKGFKPFTIGSRILRVETAIPFIISKFF